MSQKINQNELHPKKFVLVKQETPYSKVVFERQDINGVIEYVERWEETPAAFDVLSLEQFYERLVIFVKRQNYKVISFEVN
jgi:hypothetical protein